jgi:hypothetical protein
MHPLTMKLFWLIGSFRQFPFVRIIPFPDSQVNAVVICRLKGVFGGKGKRRKVNMFDLKKE